MTIAVVDGQGGGLGKTIIEEIKKELGETIKIIGLGTNGLATSLMLKAGADKGATGENAIIYNSEKVDLIVGSVAIIAANTMLGEITPLMAQAIGKSHAKKLLIPLNMCNIEVVGIINTNIAKLIKELVERVKETKKQKTNDNPKQI